MVELMATEVTSAKPTKEAVVTIRARAGGIRTQATGVTLRWRDTNPTVVSPGLEGYEPKATAVTVGW